MQIIGDVVRQISDDDGPNDAELERLGLSPRRILVDHMDKERGDYPIYLFGDGTLYLNFAGQAGVMLSRAETARLLTFLGQPYFREVIASILRADLLESSPEAAEVLAELDKLSPAERRKIAKAMRALTAPSGPVLPAA